MPDGARLTGAVLMGLLGYVLSMFVVPLMEEDTNFGWFFHINVLIGLLVGWRWIGSRAGRSWVSAINVGLTGGFVLIFWGIFVQAVNEMVRLAMKNRYDGAFEAGIAIFEIGTEYGILIGTPLILVTAALWGVLTGFLVEVAWRIWR
ncbi:MAG: TrgA family protein [Pseudomonadota bacterium]